MRSLIMILTFLMLTFVTGNCQTTNPQYFPNKVFVDSDNDQDSNDFLVKWYSDMLIALEEPSLFQISQESNSQCYRFLWLRTFHKPMSFRIVVSANGSGVLFVKISDGQGGYGASKLIKELTMQLKNYQIDEFLSKIEKACFWDLSTNEPPDIQYDEDGNIPFIVIQTDGAQWIYEGVKDGVYHVVERNSGDKVYRDVGLYLIQLSGLKIENIY